MIIVKLQGGLGNQMFQYAIGKNLSIKYKKLLKFDVSYLFDRTPRENFVYRDLDLNIFNVKTTFASKRDILPFFINKNIHLFESEEFIKKYDNYMYFSENMYNYDQNALNFSKVYLDGYWQSPKYFNEIEDLLRMEFTLRSGLQINAKSILSDIINNESVCLNVRRTDYVNFPNTNLFHGVMEESYFSNAIELLKTKRRNIKIFIFSDDLDWCARNLEFDVPTFFVSHKYAGNKFEQYFKLMSMCKHFVIPNSTFGWWAAWKGQAFDKIVISPKQWFRSDVIDTSDLIPENWIRL